MSFINCADAPISPYIPSSSKAWNQQRAIHLARRLNLGFPIGSVQQMLQNDPVTLTRDLINQSDSATLWPEPDWAFWDLNDYSTDPGTRNMQITDQVLQLAINWLRSRKTGGIRERLSHFWHDHFVAQYDIYVCPSYLYQYYHLLQKYALGNFKEFIHEIGRTPAMLVFLNGVQNTRFDPNENYARELFELFSLGLDNGYTQQDITEAARALTGWNNLTVACGPITFQPLFHDPGTKKIFGRTGNWDYDDLINILFEERAVEISEFLCKKLYHYFVNPKEDEQIIMDMAQTMRDNNFEIKPVILELFTSDHFFEEAHIGTIIPSHTELSLTILNELSLFTNDELLLAIAAESGDYNERILNPPDVSGWPGNRNWINTNSLSARWTLSHALIGNQFQNIDPEIFRGFAISLVGQNEKDPEVITKAIVDYLLPRGMQFEHDYQTMVQHFKAEIPENYFQDGSWNLNWNEAPYQVALLLVHLFSYPEFQLR